MTVARQAAAVRLETFIEDRIPLFLRCVLSAAENEPDLGQNKTGIFRPALGCC
jgi:hypothetical protein